VIQVNALAADQLKAMSTKASEEGINLYLTAGYISYETQDDYFNDRAGMVGEAEANKVIAKAGFSEHQTGLAVDFSDKDDGTATTTAFAESAAGKWLKEHAWEYGFIQRYPEGKEEITSYSYMPWHYRYVGYEHARRIHEADICLEEYLDETEHPEKTEETEENDITENDV
jgi:D-alanyl-D-alanine carboxypeptidase